MIKKVEIITNVQPQTELEKSILRVFNGVATRLNELVDAVNALVYEHDKDSDWYDGQTRADNVQPDYVTTSYMTDGHTKEYFGQNEASVVTDPPLPTGYTITIREPETKGGDND